MTNVLIAGVGQTKFGEVWNKNLRQLAVEASVAALNDKNILEKIKPEAVYVGNMAAGSLIQQEHLGALVADHLGIRGLPSMRCESACASGSVALRQGWLAIKSGLHDAVLVVGAEKMTDVDSSRTLSALMGAGDHEWEAMQGLTFAGLFALIARRHMHDFGTTREQLAMISVNNHSNGLKNPYAQFRNDIKIEDVLNATMVADPLGVLDCSPITDGAAAVLLVSEKLLNRIEIPVWLKDCVQANDSLALHDRQNIITINSVRSVGKYIYEKNDLKPSMIDVIEVHDCFSINELICLEDLGFCDKGCGGKFVEDGEIKLSGSVPTNTHGGLKSIGHPVGATGIRQVYDLTLQLRGKSFNQIHCKNALALNIGGTGASAVASLLTNDIGGKK